MTIKANNPIVFGYPGSSVLAQSLAQHLRAPKGEVQFDHFPDEESYVRIKSNVAGKDVIIVCSLHRPDSKFLPLIYFALTAQELKANQILLVAPYLAYLRQDKRFNSGEALSAVYFGQLLSQHFDYLITVEPHLHGDLAMEDIFTIPALGISAAPVIRDWVQTNVNWPLLIGPDQASLELIDQVNQALDAPTSVFTKKRLTGFSVTVEYQDLSEWQQYTPVIIDDIISTGHTMLETLKHIVDQGLPPAICIGVHGIYANHAYTKLRQNHVKDIITANTIQHESNGLDVTELIATKIRPKSP